MRISVIINKDGGTIRQSDPEAVRDSVAAALGAGGHDADVALLPAEDLRDAIRRAVAAGVGAVVVGGGDGTVSTAAALLAGTDVALGVLPLGTMNLYARTLGMPLAVEGAARAIASGRIVDADVAEIDGRCFIRQLSIGLQPLMVRLRERRGPTGGRIGKMLASALALRTALRRPPVHDLALTEDGHRRRVVTAGLIISNNPYGEGHLPYADDPATGRLGVYAVRSARWVDLVQLVAALLWGRWRQDRNVDARTARDVTIAAAAPDGPTSIAATVDGELVRLTLPITVGKRSKALKVIVAADGT